LPLAEDVKNVLDVSTLGPYSFNVFMQGSWTATKVSNIPKGRRPLVSVSMAGSISQRKHPLAADITRTVKQPRAKKSKSLMSDDFENNLASIECNVRVTRSGKKVVQ